MSIEEEIAQTLHERFAPEHVDHWDQLDDIQRRDSEYAAMAAALMPLVKRAQAEALREHGRAVAKWEDCHSPKVPTHSVERIIADLNACSDRIEKEAGA